MYNYGLYMALPTEHCAENGKEFLCLTESDIKSMVPPIGLARKVMRLLPTPEVLTSNWCVKIFSCPSNWCEYRDSGLMSDRMVSN